MSVISVNAANFESEVLKSDKPVLVDFWASWCMPCKMLSPIVDKVSESHPEVKFCKVNVDECGALAGRFGVNAIPALFLFKDGKVANSSVGLIPAETLEELIAK